MTILVTGGGGFIGSNLVRRLQSDGAGDVRILDNFSTGFEENLNGVDAQVFRGSILDDEVLTKAAKGADAIVHLAARPSVPRSIADPLASHHVNSTGTLMVLEAARRENAHVVLASSSSVYGANPTLPKSEELRPMPMSPYAVSKLATESYALAYQSVYDLTVLPFRFFNVYGPWQRAGHAYAAVVPQFISQALTGETLTVHGDGEQSRDFTFVDTVTETLSLAARERISSPDPVNLAFGTRHTLLDVISRLEKILGRTLPVEHASSRAGDVRHSQADQTRLRALVQTVEPVDLDTGLAATVQWMKQLDATSTV